MDKFEALSNDLAHENVRGSVFLKERISAESVRTAFSDNRAVLMELSGRIVGVCILWNTPSPLWLEIGSLWVSKETRKKGVASNLYRECVGLVPKNNHCLVVTHNPHVARIAAHNGFCEATTDDWFDRAPYESVCGPCDRWETTSEKRRCHLRAVTTACRLFVK